MFKEHSLRRLMRRLSGLVFRLSSDILFVLDCRDSSMPKPEPGEAFVVLEQKNLANSQRVSDALLRVSSENAEYLDDIRRRRIVGFVLMRGDQVVHFSYLFLENKTACILGLDRGTALIGNAYTVPSYRGKRAQPRSVHARAWLACRHDFKLIVAVTSLDNLASQKGMENGGMKRAGRMETVVLLNVFVIRWRRPAGFPLLGFCLDGRLRGKSR